MEPYIRMEISDGLLQQLKTQLNELSGLVNTATNHAEGGSNEIASRLNSMSGYVDNAANELNNVRLNASIDSVITGDGSHSSDTLIGGGKGAAAASTTSIPTAVTAPPSGAAVPQARARATRAMPRAPSPARLRLSLHRILAG